MRPEPLSELISELRTLSDRELRLTLGMLIRAEQDQVLAMLDADEQPEPAFETLAAISPWLLKRLEAVRSGAKADCKAPAVTPAARQALLGAFNQLVSKQAAAKPEPKRREAAPLLGRIFARPRHRVAVR